MREKYICTMEKYENQCIENGDNDFAKHIENIEEVLNLEDDTLASYLAIAYLDGVQWDEFTQMAVAIFSKNLNYVYTAFVLNRKGQYAAARAFFRNE